MEEINYVNFLGEGKEVLDPQELHKPVPILLGGGGVLTFVDSLIH
jgi:hypothetical protein